MTPMRSGGRRRDLFLSLVFGVGIIVFAGVLSSYRAPYVDATDVTTGAIISVCGDGIVSQGETCDDGTANNIGGYGSSTVERRCLSDCMSFDAYCGDDILQVRFSEQCDDGNNTTGDLCSPSCTPESPTVPIPNGTPTVGSTPSIPGATPGTIPSAIETKVVLRGKAYPGSSVKILLDGKTLTTVTADNNADFLFSSTEVTPGTATFGFSATDKNGTASIINTVVFEVLQSAITTVANIFIPPTIKVSQTQVDPGELLTISGQSVPNAKVATQISTASSTLTSTTDGSGTWALQIDTDSLPLGFNAAKASFQISDTIKSGYGKSVNFYIGTEAAPGEATTDINGDDKVNLTDFSIFLLGWNTADVRSDFNQDGKVNLADFSILLFNWTG